MKTTDFLIFISIVITVYFGANFYIFARAYQSLQSYPGLKLPFYFIFGFLSLSFIAHVIMVRLYPSDICTIFTYTGSFWLGAMLYLVLGIVILDLLRLANHFFHFFPEFVTANYGKTKLIAAVTVTASAALILFFGFLNARNPQVKELDLTINKNAGNLKELRIVMASDIHIGNIITYKETKKLADKINGLKPDIVIFPGDILDESIEPVLKYKSGDPLMEIRSKYGIYASTGNHEFIGGIDESVPYLQSLGINILRDSSALIDNSFYIVGREDRASGQFAGIKRKKLEELTGNLDKSKPIILMDHQPFNLRNSAENGVDLHLSGHTHHGQLWPFNYITEMVYELSRGYKKIGDTHYYVSSGYGSWGPPVRTGNTPELLVFNIKFNSD